MPECRLEVLYENCECSTVCSRRHGSLPFGRRLRAILREATNHEMIDRETAVFLNRVAKLDLVFDEKGDQVDMCKAMEDNNRMREVTGAIKGMRIAGMADDDILTKVMEAFHVTKEYVLALLAPKRA